MPLRVSALALLACLFLFAASVSAVELHVEQLTDTVACPTWKLCRFYVQVGATEPDVR